MRSLPGSYFVCELGIPSIQSEKFQRYKIVLAYFCVSPYERTCRRKIQNKFVFTAVFVFIFAQSSAQMRCLKVCEKVASDSREVFPIRQYRQVSCFPFPRYDLHTGKFESLILSVKTFLRLQKHRTKFT
jgi:hypothetical protein